MPPDPGGMRPVQFSRCSLLPAGATDLGDGVNGVF
jgi:hypothetical protein